ncbi:HemK methyltransferase family member 1 [Microtus ochrogaster]|uniref:peptide chain release factor N(5)-glutamine methyltransferase n=1 Tax=Microtus ochrogaster TaxID=79684 RepID=A0A8J6KRU7_MICOH|nr:HemK methyltransferase family member 1 [Microtus ochrogaster]
MKLWGQILWTLLSGSRGRRGAPQGWALNSWKPRSSLSGQLSATEVVSHWTQVFEQRGIPEAQESSEYIVAHVLGAKTVKCRVGDKKREEGELWGAYIGGGELLFYFVCLRVLSRDWWNFTEQMFQADIRSPNKWMPVQYILGEWDFQGLSLKMEPPVFIPRPETEELVEWVLEEVAQRPPAVGAQGGPLILEVGCGSGAIALSLLSQLPESQVIAVDKGEAAVRLTRKNAQRYMDQEWTTPFYVSISLSTEGCWTHLLPWGPIDLVVSNPPYVFHKDMEQLAPEISSYEDLVALDGGEEGMDIITCILTLAPQLLNASGSIFLEVDPRHPELVSSWLQSRPDLRLSLVAVRKDFCGRSLRRRLEEDEAATDARLTISDTGIVIARS